MLHYTALLNVKTTAARHYDGSRLRSVMANPVAANAWLVRGSGNCSQSLGFLFGGGVTGKEVYSLKEATSNQLNGFFSPLHTLPCVCISNRIAIKSKTNSRLAFIKQRQNTPLFFRDDNEGIVGKSDKKYKLMDIRMLHEYIVVVFWRLVVLSAEPC